MNTLLLLIGVLPWAAAWMLLKTLPNAKNAPLQSRNNAIKRPAAYHKRARGK